MSKLRRAGRSVLLWILREEGQIQMTLAELNTKIDNLQATANTIVAEVAALKAAPAGPTPEELDAVGAKVDAVQATLAGA